MPANRATEADLLAAALGPTAECLSLETLTGLRESDATSLEAARHLESCAYCRTELQLLRAFEAGATDDSDKLREVTRRLQNMRLPAAPMATAATRRPAEVRRRRWDFSFAFRPLAMGSAAAAGLLLVAATFMALHQAGRPILMAGNVNGPGVFRSLSFAVLSPVGDLPMQPSEVRWESVAQATSYQVRLLEVDQTEAWKAQTSQNLIELPPAIRARIVPSKTLFFEVTAFDSAGNKVGETGLARFRLLPKPASN
jgi:hypothetical protein